MSCNARPSHNWDRPPTAETDGSAEEWNELRRTFIAPKSESAGVFEKEVAFFREEQIEPREIDLLLINFDLREVGAVGGVESERWCQAVL